MNNEQTPLQRAAAFLSDDWQAGVVQPVTDASERDWLESRERAYRLADATDARAARLAARDAAAAAQAAGTATWVARPKVKRVKVAPSEGGLFNLAA